MIGGNSGTLKRKIVFNIVLAIALGMIVTPALGHFLQRQNTFSISVRAITEVEFTDRLFIPQRRGNWSRELDNFMPCILCRRSFNSVALPAHNTFEKRK